MLRTLLYENTVFIESERESINTNSLAILELNKTSNTGKLYLNPEIGTIDRLTVLRIANSICRAGFLFSDNERIGSKFNLQITNDFNQFFTQNDDLDNVNGLEFQPKPVKITGTESENDRGFESITDYFWRELFGKVYSSWEQLPMNAKNDLFSLISVEYLSNEHVQELFQLRHQNNKEKFIQKLKELKND